MDDQDQLARWLQAQPLGGPVAIDGETVWLRPGVDGAELAACLWRDPSAEQVRDALRQGWTGAREFDAGLSLADDGRGLLLSLWLSPCRSWSEAAPALEQLLDQLAGWRAVLTQPERPRMPAGGASRQEQRMRSLLARGLP